MKIVCWPFLFIALFLTACAPASRDEQTSVTTTYSPPTPTVSKEGSYDVVHGATSVADMYTQFDAAKKGLSLRGKVNVRPLDGAAAFVVNVDMEGTADSKGFVYLQATKDQASLPPEVKMGAKATCLGKNYSCDSSFIDIYVEFRGKVYHHQVESHQEAAAQTPVLSEEPSAHTPSAQTKPEEQKPAPAKPVDNKSSEAKPAQTKPAETKPAETKPVETKPTTPAKPTPSVPAKPAAPATKPEPAKPATPNESVKPETRKPVVKAEEEDEADEGEDDAELAGRYQGDIAGDIDKVINNKKDSDTKVPELKGQKLDQVISPTKKGQEGRLENASNLLAYERSHAPAGFHVVNPKRERYYGSQEIVYLIAQMGQFTRKLIPNYVLPIGDVSAKTGGKLGTHASHQNGLDADIAFYFKDQKIQGNLFSALQNGKTGRVLDSWMVEEQWKLLKYAVSSKYVDRIFIHQSLKNSLCQYAIKTGDIKKEDKTGDAYELLRRLRPEKNHYNHFHLRVKCSKAQVRCRQMADPAPGTGCFS